VFGHSRDESVHAIADLDKGAYDHTVAEKPALDRALVVANCATPSPPPV
jgi:hypothetical protein